MGLVGVAHWFVMVGFGALFLTLVEAVRRGRRPGVRAAADRRSGRPYGLFVEVHRVGTVLGIVVLIVDPAAGNPRRSGRASRFAGSNFGQAYFVEAVILSIGRCGSS